MGSCSLMLVVLSLFLTSMAEETESEEKRSSIEDFVTICFRGRSSHTHSGIPIRRHRHRRSENFCILAEASHNAIRHVRRMALGGSRNIYINHRWEYAYRSRSIFSKVCRIGWKY